MNFPRYLPIAVLACAGAALAGCTSSTTGAAGIDKAQVIETLNDAARQNLGAPFDQIDCDEGLDPVVGDRTRCVVETAGVRAALDLTVTTIENGDLNFEWTLDENSRVLTAASVEADIRRMFKDRTGTDLTALDCGGDVPARVDSTRTCATTGVDGIDRTATVRVTGADGIVVTYEWTVN